MTATAAAWFGVARRTPTDDDRHEATEAVLNGLAHGDDRGDGAGSLTARHPLRNTLPGVVLLVLAVGAGRVSSAPL
jgi:hypothetical protein